MYDEPPEPTEEQEAEWATQRAIKALPSVRIEGLSAEAVEIILRSVIENTFERLFADTRAKFRETVAHKVDELVQEYGREEIQEAVRKTLEEGWRETNSYGEPTGERVTLKQRLAKLLTERRRDNYSSPEETILERAAREQIKAKLDGEFKAEFDRAREAFRLQVDKVVTSKLAATLRSALGLT